MLRCLTNRLRRKEFRDKTTVRDQTAQHQNNHSARGQRYRYIRHPNGEEQLYDHQTDPDEFTNLAESRSWQKSKLG